MPLKPPKGVMCRIVLKKDHRAVQREQDGTKVEQSSGYNPRDQYTQSTR